MRYASQIRWRGITVFFVTFFVVTGGVCAMPTEDESRLRALIIHYNQSDYQKFGTECKKVKLRDLASNKNFTATYPISELQSIELCGDEVDLPTALILSLIARGKISEGTSSTAQQSISNFRIRLKDGGCLSFSRFFDSLDGSPSFTTADGAVLALPPERQSRYPRNVISKGMTRAQLQNNWHADGGLSAPFKSERYVLGLSGLEKEGLVTKVNLRFKPAGMSDAVYLLGKWQIPKPSEDDTVSAYSPLYLEPQFTD